jgi:hypothetical protein
MKRFFLVCSLLITTLALCPTQQASAQVVTAASFMVQVNQMDTYIGAGNLPMAQVTFDTLNAQMKRVLGVSKSSLYAATTPADQATYRALINNQVTIYQAIWALKPDLVTNRTAIHAKLGDFDATIY